MRLIKHNLRVSGVFSVILVYFPYGQTKTFKEVPMNSTGPVTVSPCYSGKAYDIEIFNESLTRAQADYSCKQRGFQFLHEANAGWNRWFHIRDILVDAGYHGNIAFWEGRFRPFFHVKEWYRESKVTCKLYSKDLITENGDPFSQCSEVRWDSFTSPPTLFARNCSGSLPFMCVRYDGTTYFNTYAGYMVSQGDNSTTSGTQSETNDTITAYDECAQLCLDTKSCTSFVFNHSRSSLNCVTTNVLYGYGPGSHEITPGHGNITLGVKTGCSVNFNDTPRIFSVNGIKDTLLDCGLSPIPANYCQCGKTEQINPTNSAQLERKVNSLVFNLTIPKDATSLSNRKLTSAKDERASAKVFGSVGIIILTIVLALPVLSDVFTYGLDFNFCGKSKKKKTKRNTCIIEANGHVYVYRSKK